ncbi:IMPACT family protein [Gordonia shandongensis]|uniref:IMPACT family protein n=1 Tax=Gordonia shandongensis TaxID=376351 RepID=UPI0003F66B71|nr:YigZ family protein [Gordonia shandongensis]
MIDRSPYLSLPRGAETTGVLEVKRSRFLAVVRSADSEDAARDTVAELRRAHRDARHHCSAFVIGPHAEIARTNDDGEPSGTAGAPMLDVLRGADLSDVVAVVVRWFGGTLLGAGGLARAYGDAVSLALADAPVVRREPLDLVRLALPHADAGRVEADLRGRGVHVLDTEYAAEATLLLATSDPASVDAAVAAATAGAGRLEPAGTRWVETPVR